MPFMVVTVLTDNGAFRNAFCDINALPARSRGAVALLGPPRSLLVLLGRPTSNQRCGRSQGGRSPSFVFCSLSAAAFHIDREEGCSDCHPASIVVASDWQQQQQVGRPQSFRLSAPHPEAARQRPRTTVAALVCPRGRWPPRSTNGTTASANNHLMAASPSGTAVREAQCSGRTWIEIPAS